MAIACCLRRHRIHLGDPLRLAQTFVVSEEESAIFHYGSTDRTAELIPMERGLGRVEEIPGVERAIADVFKRVAMEILRSRSCRSTNNAARRAPELCWVIARQHGELLNGVRAQIHAQSTARRTVHVVV